MSQYQMEFPTLERQLSIEQTYELAATARRKSSSHTARNQLRMRLGHAHMLGALEYAIRTSPPPSPKQTSYTPSPSPSFKELSPASPPTESRDEVDEYGFAYDDEEEDMNSLSLCRTQSRRD